MQVHIPGVSEYRHPANKDSACVIIFFLKLLFVKLFVPFAFQKRIKPAAKSLVWH